MSNRYIMYDTVIAGGVLMIGNTMKYAHRQMTSYICSYCQDYLINCLSLIRRNRRKNNRCKH